MGEPLEPVAGAVMQSVVGCLDVDNEENALLCLRILFELFKNVKNSAMEVRRFLPFPALYVARGRRAFDN